MYEQNRRFLLVVFIAKWFSTSMFDFEELCESPRRWAGWRFTAGPKCFGFSDLCDLRACDQIIHFTSYLRKWFEELASESNGSTNLFQRAILYRHKKIYQCHGRLQAISGRNYVYICDGLSSISQDWSVRLASRLVRHTILSFCICGLCHLENSYERAWCETRSVHLIEIGQISCSDDLRHAQMDTSGPRGPRWRTMSLRGLDPRGARVARSAYMVRQFYAVVINYGAKHSPSGEVWPPDCLEGVPPVCFPGPPLIYHISGFVK